MARAVQAVANEAKREATVVASALDVQDNARIELDHVTKRFLTPKGEAFTAIRDVNLVVEPGQFCAVVGPTGCGKSTTLTLVSGLDRPSAGEVRVGGKVVEGIARGISFVLLRSGQTGERQVNSSLSGEVSNIRSKCGSPYPSWRRTT